MKAAASANCLTSDPAAERFFATVKLDAIPEDIFVLHQQARRVLFNYIEVFYNRQRRHSVLGYAGPVSRAI
ncbi:MAG: hypothetical protein DWB42_06955 [Chloroflexi bacterium]|nr:hypothetical protein [Chloroflexota bacterium]MDL1883216.1 transposase [Anaerolineae bacterium CFX8]